MPDLGVHAKQILLSYEVSLALLCALVAVSAWQSRRMKRALAEAEERKNQNGG